MVVEVSRSAAARLGLATKLSGTAAAPVACLLICGHQIGGAADQDWQDATGLMNGSDVEFLK